MSEEVIRPWLDCDRAKQLLKSQFGFEAAAVKELASYDDRNFRMQLCNTDTECQNWPHGFVLKVTNWVDSLQREFIKSTCLMLEHVCETVPTSRPIRTLSGEFFATARFPIGDRFSKMQKECVVRLFAFLPGETLHGKAVAPSVCFQWGSLAGRLHRSLAEVNLPAIECRFTPWSVYNVHDIEQYLGSVDLSEEQTTLVRDILREAHEVFDRIRRLPTAILHGDLNEQNVLIRNGNLGEDVEVYAVLDWGDVHAGPRVLDLAVTLTYVLLAPSASRHPFENVGLAMAGYMQHMPLECDDIGILKTLMCSRMCQSLVLGRRAYMRDPGNEYVLYTQSRGWNALQELWDTPCDHLQQIWNSVLRENGLELSQEEPRAV